jgi:DNA-binding response OmpR family regulator
MSTQPLLALIIDSDGEARNLTAATLSEAGFVVSGFAQPRSALAAMAARPVELAVIASRLPDGSDGFSAARLLRHGHRGLKVLFTANTGALPAMHGVNDGYVVTHPFDRRRFLGSVFELLGRGQTGSIDQRAAEIGLAQAELACLFSRYAAAERGGSARQTQDVIYRILDAIAAQHSRLSPADAPGKSH